MFSAIVNEIWIYKQTWNSSSLDADLVRKYLTKLRMNHWGPSLSKAPQILNRYSGVPAPTGPVSSTHSLGAGSLLPFGEE